MQSVLNLNTFGSETYTGYVPNSVARFKSIFESPFSRSSGLTFKHTQIYKPLYTSIVSRLVVFFTVLCVISPTILELPSPAGAHCLFPFTQKVVTNTTTADSMKHGYLCAVSAVQQRLGIVRSGQGHYLC